MAPLLPCWVFVKNQTKELCQYSACWLNELMVSNNTKWHPYSMDSTLIFFAGISDPLEKEAIEKCSPWRAKKKIGEPLEHCLPPHLPLLWILICVQEMGINCWSIMELPLPIKCHSRSWSGRLRVCLTKNKREKCENYFGTWTVLLH